MPNTVAMAIATHLKDAKYALKIVLELVSLPPPSVEMGDAMQMMVKPVAIAVKTVEDVKPSVATKRAIPGKTVRLVLMTVAFVPL